MADLRGARARGVERVAYGLRAHGVEPGSVVSCQLPNWNEFVLVSLAASRLGAVVNPIPSTYRAHELRFMLALLESQGLARYKFPERREVVSEFPMTPSGKIQKYRLRQLVAERAAAGRGGGSAEWS